MKSHSQVLQFITLEKYFVPHVGEWTITEVYSSRQLGGDVFLSLSLDT